jgi:hypothetical protein
MGDRKVKFVLFNEKIMFRSHLIKSNHRVLRKSVVDGNGATVLYLIVVPLFYW